MRVVAVGTVAQSARMLNFRRLNVLSLIVMTGDAERLRIFLYENYFPVLRRCMAGFAIATFESRVLELRHQFRSG